MKRFISLLFFVSLLVGGTNLTTVSAQPHTFNYQAVVRNADGIALADEVVDFTVRILQGDSLLYEEFHYEVNSGPQGIVNLSIGAGQDSLGSITDIPWNETNLALEVLIDDELVARAQMVAVPVALYARSAEYSNYAKSAANWKVRNGSTSYVERHIQVGIGTDTPSMPFEVAGEGMQVTKDGNIVRLETSPLGLSVFKGGSGTLSLGYLNNSGAVAGLRATSASGVGNFAFDPRGYLGVNETSPNHPLTVRARETGSGIILTGPWPSVPLSMYHYQGENNRSFPAIDLGGGTILYGSGRTSRFSGRLEVDILRVNGADIAERCHGPENLQPGEVISMVPGKENTGIRSTEAYDGKVLGVVCGAGGVRQGIEMAQDGVMDGNILFAVAGRVWVQVTGKVKPGDLLTSSNVPGKAMAARKPRKGRGATLGVALTQKNEKGMALMIVNRN